MSHNFIFNLVEICFIIKIIERVCISISAFENPCSFNKQICIPILSFYYEKFIAFSNFFFFFLTSSLVKNDAQRFLSLMAKTSWPLGSS